MLREIGCLLIALFYASLLASLPMEGLMDRDNYLNAARVSPLTLAHYFDQGILVGLTNEPVWLGINSILGFSLEPDVVVRIAVFFSAFTVAYLVLKHSNQHFILLILVLLFPLVIKNFIVHLRQGVAIAFFAIGWFASGKKTKYVFYTMSPLTHSSFFLILPLMFLREVLTRLRLAIDVKAIVYVLSGVTVGISIVFLASLLGARQADTTALMDSGVSGVGFVMWALIALLLVLQGRSFLDKNTFAIGALLFYLATYFLTPIAGRLFESAVLFVLLAGLTLTSYRKYGFMLIILAFTLVYFIMKLGQPLMGFGTT